MLNYALADSTYGLSNHSINLLVKGKDKFMKSNSKVAVAEVGSEDTVFVSGFEIPEIKLLAGVQDEGASISLLQTQASQLVKDAKAITDKVAEGILPYVAKIQAYGESSGVHAGQSFDDYCAASFKATLPNGAKVEVAKSVVFGETAVAMVMYLVSGGLQLAKFEQFALSNVILKKAKPSTNAGKGEAFKAITDDGDEAIFSLQSAGIDKDGNLKGWFEVLAKAAKAIYVEKDELKALGYLDGMEKKTGLNKEALQAIVQFIINATVAREMKKQAKKFSDKAVELSQKRFTARREAERSQELERVKVANETKGLGQAH